MGTPARNSLKTEIQEIHRLANTGKDDEARARIHALLSRRVRLTPNDALNLATLARLMFRPDITLRLLNRRVNPSGRAGRIANDEEIAQYGMALSEVGAVGEGLALLARLDYRKKPKALLFRCLSEFKRWNWAPMVAPLRGLTRFSQTAPLDRVAAQVRLGAALLHGAGDFSGALEAFEAAERAFEKTEIPAFLKRDNHLLRLQARVLSKDRSAARREYAAIEPEFAGAQESLAGRSLRMWRLIIEFEERGDPKAFAAEMKTLSDDHFTRAEFERARAVDFYRAKYLDDRDLLVHLWFGTPWPAFKARVAGLLGEIPAEYEWRLSGKAGAPWLELASGRAQWGILPLKTGQNAHRMLQALASDFYRAPNTAELHEAAYPGHHFHPTASPLKIRQSLARLRLWLKAHRTPLEVEESGGRYRLQARSPLTLRLSAPDAASGATSGHLLLKLEDLRKGVGDGAFSVNAAAKRWKTTARTALRLLGRAVKDGRALREGKGPSTRYRLRS